MRFLSLDKSHVDLIVDFYKENFNDGWNKQMLLSAFEGQRYFSIGVFFGDELVGVIGYTLLLDDADIESVVVKESFKRQGIASALIDLAIIDIIKNRKQKIFLEVRKSNLPAINLYTKCGFSELSVRKKYYADGEDAIILVKDLVEED